MEEIKDVIDFVNTKSKQYQKQVKKVAQNLIDLIMQKIHSIGNPIMNKIYIFEADTDQVMKDFGKLCGDIRRGESPLWDDVSIYIRQLLKAKGYYLEFDYAPGRAKTKTISLERHGFNVTLQAPKLNWIFRLKPSKINGVGVFACVKIKTGEVLPLFSGDDNTSIFISQQRYQNLPKIDQKYCDTLGINVKTPESGYWVPPNPYHLEIGWYLNHSDKPNAYHDDEYRYYASRDISAGEEILIDYNQLSDGDNSI